jgi:hypothetical protein
MQAGRSLGGCLWQLAMHLLGLVFWSFAAATTVAQTAKMRAKNFMLDLVLGEKELVLTWKIAE